MSRNYALMIGSGWQHLASQEGGTEVETAWGLPSGPVHRACFGDTEVMCLARHGDGHALPPHVINYRANVVALKKLGADAIIGLNTVGVITDVREAGQIAIPDQVLDYTYGREHTIYDGRRALVEHIDFTEPFTAELRQGLLRAAAEASIDCLDGGTYAATQGPRLETAAEVDRLERDGADFVGMTAMPEAAIARELEIDYACIAMIVNPAAGRGEQPIHDAVAASTEAARNATMSTLQGFFRALS